MQAIEELYGIFVLYHGIAIASQLSCKENSYLSDCGLALLKENELFILEKGVKNISNDIIQGSSLNRLDFSSKFMEILEKHLLSLEDEVPEYHPSQLVTPNKKCKRKRRRKCNFLNDRHKKSIISDHLKSRNYIWPVDDIVPKKSLTHIFKRIPMPKS